MMNSKQLYIFFAGLVIINETNLWFALPFIYKDPINTWPIKFENSTTLWFRCKVK